MQRLVALAAGVVALAFMFSCQKQTQTQLDPKAEAATLKNIDAEWSKAAAAKDVDKTVSYYADDAIALPPHDQIATGKDAIKKIWKDYLAAPEFGGGWQATKVEVARSGEIAYLSGTWEFTWKDDSN